MISLSPGLAPLDPGRRRVVLWLPGESLVAQLREGNDRSGMMPEPPHEIEELERAAAWRLRLVDADPRDHASAAAAALLQRLAHDLRHNEYAMLWTELQSIGNWLGESDAISDYAALAAEYHRRIGVSHHPADGAAYLRALLAIAQSLI
jgi:hypothetical protein